jgi:hypothetical protein
MIFRDTKSHFVIYERDCQTICGSFPEQEGAKSDLDVVDDGRAG